MRTLLKMLMVPFVMGLALVPATPAAGADDEAEEKWYDPTTWFDEDEEDDASNRDERRTPTAERYDARDRQVLRGTLIGLERMNAGYGQVDAVQLRVRDLDRGRERIVFLGDGDPERVPMRLSEGGEVKLLARRVDIGGQTHLKAVEIRPRDSEFRTDKEDREGYQLVRGRLEGLQRVQVRDGRVEALIVRVEAEGGQTHDVLMGSESALDDGEAIRPGSRLELRGSPRELDEQTIFVARDLRSEDRTRDARRSGEAYGVARGRETERVTLRGEVETIRRIVVDEDDLDDDHTLLRLRFDDGRSQAVDFGPDVHPKRLGLDEGEEVTIEGRLAQHHGERVLLVDRIRLDGAWHTIDAPAEHQHRD